MTAHVLAVFFIFFFSKKSYPMHCLKTTLLPCLFFFMTMTAHGQVFYYVDDVSDIYTYDLANCESTFVVHIQGLPTVYGDITFAPDGNVYVISWNKIYQIDLASGERTLVTTLSQNQFYRALTSDAMGNIYIAGDVLFSYNIYNQTTTFHGDLPPMMEAAGDLTFRNGSLFLATYFKNIVLVDIDNPANSQVHFSYPDSLAYIFGISTFYFGCDSLVSFGSGSDSLFYLIDFGTSEIVPTGCSSMTIANGLATLDEWQASGCDLGLDLDGDDSSALNGPMPEDGYYQVFCGPDTVRIAGTDMVITSDYHIDSVAIETTSNANSIGVLWVTGPPVPGIQSSVNGQHAVFSNQGPATATDFENALKGLWFANSPYAPGHLEFRVAVHAGSGTVTDTALSVTDFLPGPHMLSLGADTSLCPGEGLDLALPPGLQYQIDTFSFGQATWQDGSHGSTFAVDLPGTYYADFTFEGGQGCTWADTIVVGQADTILTTGTLTACAGETVLIYGLPFVSDTTVCTQYAGAAGCDSTHCTQLVFLPPASSSLDTTVCQGQAVLSGGKLYSAPGTYIDTLSARNGCDSTVLLTLSVLPSDTTLLNVAICGGESYEVGGTVFSDSGFYEITLAGQNTCDSVVLLDLSVQPLAELQLDTAICEGGSVLFAGVAVGQPGQYMDTLSGNGCDTVLVLNLSVLPVPPLELQVETDTCGGTATLSALSPAPYFLWSDGGTGNIVEVGQSGTYGVTVTDMAGCTSEAFAGATLFPVLAAGAEMSPPLCHGGQDGAVAITGPSGGVPPYLFSINGGALSPGTVFDSLPAGGYTISVEDANGCTWDTLAVLAVPPPFVLDAGPDQVIAPGQQAVLEAVASIPVDSLWWVPSDFLECPTCPVTTATPPSDITYQVFALDSNGCPAMDEVAILVEKNGAIYAPDAFSPNGDGVNDLFTLYAPAGENARILQLSIFDRWGGQVFYGEYLLSGINGWDGNHRGKPASTGVYAWFAQVEMPGGEILFLEGGLHLVR